ncbi:MAG: hypothetical protein OXP66_14550, partial [Candidatus Tectomicrobia bacterium]|nr:hypothetical protein [Candidatus Tectomicrobia bacterium]
MSDREGIMFSFQRVAAVLVVFLGTFAAPAAGQEDTAVERGAYIFQAAGGCSCHTALNACDPGFSD